MRHLFILPVIVFVALAESPRFTVLPGSGVVFVAGTRSHGTGGTARARIRNRSSKPVTLIMVRVDYVEHGCREQGAVQRIPLRLSPGAEETVPVGIAGPKTPGTSSGAPVVTIVGVEYGDGSSWTGSEPETDPACADALNERKLRRAT